MISLEEKRAMQEALGMVARGEKYVPKNKELAWLPEQVSAEERDTFTQAVKEAYESDASEFQYDGKTFSASFVKEDKTIRMKSGFGGKIGVYLGEQMVKSFADTRQAKVYMTYLESATKNESKKPFSIKLIERVVLVD